MHERYYIPDFLNLLRESMEDGGLAVGAYTIGTFRYHCLCPNEDAEMLDLAGALENTLHALEEHGFTDDQIRTITGLELYTDPDVQEYEGEYPGAYTPIDHGWVFSTEAMDFEVVPPEECSAVLREAYLEVRIEQAAQALNEGSNIFEAFEVAQHGNRETQRFSLKGKAEAAREASAELADGKAADAPPLDRNR